MEFCQLPLNTSAYVDVSKMDRGNLLETIDKSHSRHLPVVKEGKLIGILDGYKVINESLTNTSLLDLCQTNIIAANVNDQIDIFLNIKQEIVPVIEHNMQYIGYIETIRLMDWCQFDQRMQYYRDLEEEYNIVLQSSHDGIHIIDGKGVTLRISKSCETIEGVKSENIIGKNMKQMVENLVYSKSVGLEVLNKKRPVTILQKVKNGKEILSTGTPVFKDGKVFRVVVNARDITELTQIKQELQFFRSQQVIMNDTVVKSKKMQEVFKLASRVASVDSTVLINGESGVGKGVICKLIHQNSGRKNGPFIKIDVSAIPEALLESELFGYEKGAFTGAEAKGKTGLVELADEGTLFLDEIGDLPLHLQAKLLRLIQDREFIKVGGKKATRVNIRIIAATHKNLEEMVRQKLFREDLYYRLNVVPITIPPLREHKEDIQPLIFNNLKKLNNKYGLQKKLSNDALDCLLEYHWPGNVRELENIIERLIVMSDSNTIQKHDLPKTILNEAGNKNLLHDEIVEGVRSYRTAMNLYEKKLLLKVKEKSKNTKEMAKMLQLDRSTVRRKLKKHSIDINL